MSDLGREALVAEAEKVTLKDIAEAKCLRAGLFSCPSDRGPYVINASALVDRLLSLLASEGEKVQELEARASKDYERHLCAVAAGNLMASEIENLEADRDRLQAEVERLKADVAFKDGLIWTSRESELYKATVAAEKRAEKAEAEVTRLSEASRYQDEALSIAAAENTALKAEVTQLTARLARVTQAANRVLHCSHGCCSPCPHTRLVSDLKAQLEAQR